MGQVMPHTRTQALDDYVSLPDDLVGSAKRWREWMELERPGGLSSRLNWGQ
jgi:hypothetical protein